MAAQPVVTAFWRQASDHPRRVAVREGGVEVTYGELAARAGRFAGLLRRRGTGPEDVVAVRLPRGADQVAAVLGIALAGAAYLPMDPAHPHGRAAAVLRLAGPDIPLVTSPAEAERWRADGVEVLDPAAADEPFDGPGEHPPDRLAYVIYTSGSTGEPKGVMIDHHALAVFAGSQVGTHDLGPGDRVAMVASPGFDAAVFETWPALTAGATITVADTPTVLTPGLLRDWMVAERVKTLFLTTAIGTPLLGTTWPEDGALRTLMVGGERLTARPAPGLPFEVLNMYGPTEATVFTTAGLVRPDGDGLPSIGGPVAGARLRVLDADRRPATPGEVGELHIGGPGVARGYFRRPDLTAERFTADEDGVRWYRTGDLVRLRPDGEHDFVGRTDDQVKIRGNRIEPDELRAVVETHPDVVAAHVSVRHRETPDAHLVAYVVTGSGGDAPADLAAHLKERLPAFMLPRHVVALPALPLTANGKVDRAALPEPAAPAVAAPAAATGGLDEVEAAVVGVWRRVLSLDAIGRDDSFFDLGGHSLLLADVHRRLTGELGYAVELVELFEHHTVRGLADRLRRGADGGAGEERAEPVELASASFRSSGRDRLRRLRAQRRGTTNAEGAQR
ncbi:non-ribosomal peptide synthetase [Saccharothrix xinjiangensis]|uniref:Non-ribosomal peptide synthetase n=1 Tax=Saccharothrix xinjiangensis TaxID=204798 RepID=A0ABV9YEQ8_9PSEU